MSKQSAKPSGRTAKAARQTTAKIVKKTAKSARGVSKSASKSARASKNARTAAIRAPSIAIDIAVKILRTPSPPMQPIVAHEAPSRAHKYQVGETVYFTSPTFGRAAASGSYTVVKLLPSEGDDYQYRIKSSGEAFERVAKESQLDRA
jgi:hypothetical protein